MTKGPSQRSIPRVVVMGGSAGSIQAIQHLLTALPENSWIPFVIALHVPESSEVHLERIIQPGAGYRVLEAYDKAKVDPKTIYFAPPSYHLLIEGDGTLSLSQDDPVHFSRPSIDVLFESAALAFGEQVCGVLLTGANEDGAEGLKSIHLMGGTTIVQDPRTAAHKTMPEAALKTFSPHYVWTLENIRRNFIESLSKESPWNP